MISKKNIKKIASIIVTLISQTAIYVFPQGIKVIKTRWRYGKVNAEATIQAKTTFFKENRGFFFS